jgi:hypothetical protein
LSSNSAENICPQYEVSETTNIERCARTRRADGPYFTLCSGFSRNLIFLIRAIEGHRGIRAHALAAAEIPPSTLSGV